MPSSCRNPETLAALTRPSEADAVELAVKLALPARYRSPPTTKSRVLEVKR